MSRPISRAHRTLRVMALACALAAVAILPACGAKQTRSSSVPPQVLGAPGTVVMVIRHGEKPPGSSGAGGIDAAGSSGNEGTRPRETVQPLADHLGLHEDSTFGKGDEVALVTRVASRPGPTLISWQHQEIPAIAAAFGNVTPAPPSSWPGDRFDVVWTFTATPHGWTFAQVPEMVLPGDSSATLQ